MESNKQERKNLLDINPLSKHMSTPLQMGGSPLYTFEGGLHAKNIKHSKDGEHLGKK